MRCGSGISAEAGDVVLDMREDAFDAVLQRDLVYDQYPSVRS
jgi:hypothetical protein